MKHDINLLLNDFDTIEFQKNLVTWYKAHHRDLPWRENRDPYRIWVSEIMLQQTKVDTVIPYFLNFINQFPTIEALAMAEEEKVLKAWEGLGYYSRVRNLQAAAKEVFEHYGGKIPVTRREISTLKGVGPYTAGAVLSIAFGLPEHAVDGNVMRVLSRILLVQEDIAKVSTRKIFEEIVTEIISKEHPSEFNQGMMELGALVCTPTSPGCLLCPVRSHCRAYQEGMQSQLPIKAKKKKAPLKYMAAMVIQDEGGNLLINRRSPQGLLARLWEVPNTEIIDNTRAEEELASYVMQKYGVQAEVGEAIQTVEHVFTHLKWHITVFNAILVAKGQEQEDMRWVSKKRIEEYTFPVSHQKIIGEFSKKGGIIKDGSTT